MKSYSGPAKARSSKKAVLDIASPAPIGWVPWRLWLALALAVIFLLLIWWGNHLKDKTFGVGVTRRARAVCPSNWPRYVDWCRKIWAFSDQPTK
jgi:hypothetical protein